MQRSGAATRRFYAAFYHWTLRSANPTRRCAGTTSTLVPRRRQSTTHGARGTSRPLARSREPGTSEQLRKEAVQSTADRPTKSLDLWEHVVRGKSEKSVAVELLVPRRVLRSKDVAKKAQLHEVKLSTPGPRDDAGDDEPYSVVLEGDYTDVKAVWKSLYYHGGGQSLNGSTATNQATHADVEPVAHKLRQDFAHGQQQSLVEKECSLPESFWQPIGKEGTIEYLQTRFGLQVDVLDKSGPLQYARLKGSKSQVLEVDNFLDDIRTRELERKQRKNIVDNTAEKQVKIVRRTDLPSESLEAWQFVTRRQLQGQTEIDACLPERVWQQITRNGGAENLHARFAMEFKPLGVSQDGRTRCVTLKGDVTHADRVKRYLEGFQVNLPELQEDKEYLKIYSAAISLHTTNDGNQRQSARRSQEETNIKYHGVRASAWNSHENSAAVSPEAQPARNGAASKKLRETRPAIQEDVGRTAHRNKSYKRLELTSPEEQSTHDDKELNKIRAKGRLAVPEHMRQELEAFDESTLAQIQQESGVKAILCLETAEGKQFLKIIGKNDTPEDARALLQKSIDDNNKRTGRNNPGVDELARSIDLVYSRPIKTHVAWVQISEGTPLKDIQRRSGVRWAYASIGEPVIANSKQLLKLVGPLAAVKFVMAEIRGLMEAEPMASSKTPANFEVLKMGLVKDVGEEPPLELSGKATTPKQQTPASSVMEFDTPEQTAPPAHFAWLKVPKAYADLGRKAREITNEGPKPFVTYSKLDEEEGLVKVIGSEEAVSKAISVFQHVSDEARKGEGKPPVKVEIVSAGLSNDLPSLTAVRESILSNVLSSVKEPHTPEEGQSKKQHAWLKIASTDDHMPSFTSFSTKLDIARKYGCYVEHFQQMSGNEAVLALSGSIRAVNNAIDDLQQACDQALKKEGKRPLKAEIIYMGSHDKMPKFEAVKNSIRRGAPATGKDQASESVEKPAMPRSEAPHDEQEHCAWVKLAFDEAAVSRTRSMLRETAKANGCRLSQNMRTGKATGKFEGVARLSGSESTITSAIRAMQQMLANEIPETLDKPAGTAELIQMGLKKDLFGLSSFKKSNGAPAVFAEQSASLPLQTSIEIGAAEQAEKVSSSSTSDKTPPHATVNRAGASKAKSSEDQATKQLDQQLSDDMRSALRHITQPVALVTSYAPHTHLQEGVERRTLARGVTVSSFCTVTLQPRPVISFNLRVPSSSWDAISGSGYMRVHLLNSSQKGASVAHAFTLPYEQPHHAFTHLRSRRKSNSIAATFFSGTTDPAKVPLITERSAIYGSFVAKAMPEKCIQVGDHMIVVAEVTETSLPASAAASNAGALAYGMRGYRQLGDEIKPIALGTTKRAEPKPSNVQPAKETETVENVPGKARDAAARGSRSVAGHVKPVVEASSEVESVGSAVNEITEPTEQVPAKDHIQSGENTPDDIATSDMNDLYQQFAADPDEEGLEAKPAPAPRTIQDLGPSSPMLDEESLRQVLEENETAYSSLGLPSQTAADNPALAEALSAVAGAYKDTSEPVVSSQPGSTSQTQASPVDQPAETAAPSQPEPKPQTEAPPVARPASSAPRDERPANALSTAKRPWGLDDTMTQQIRKLSIYHTSPPHRHYSSSSPKPPPEPTLSKQILKTTVADYLCQIPTHRKRYTNLINLQRHAETLESQLHQNQNQPPPSPETENSPALTEAEVAILQTRALTARRAVTRELALRNAVDLRAMLDKGRVASAGAAQWLESSLEQGQVVLLDEAKGLRRELEEGGLREADFERAKGELMRDYEVLEGTLMRLREFAEEEGEGFDDGDEGVVGEGKEGGGRG